MPRYHACGNAVGSGFESVGRAQRELRPGDGSLGTAGSGGGSWRRSGGEVEVAVVGDGDDGGVTLAWWWEDDFVLDVEDGFCWTTGGRGFGVGGVVDAAVEGAGVAFFAVGAVVGEEDGFFAVAGERGGAGERTAVPAFGAAVETVGRGVGG